MQRLGRRPVKIEINFNRPLESLDQIMEMCTNPMVKKNVITFATSLINSIVGSESIGCQTNTDASSMIDNICDQTQDMAGYEKSFLLSMVWKQIHEIDQVKMMFMFFNELSCEGQCDLFTLLGKELNKDIYEATKSSEIVGKLDLESLKRSNKTDFYKSCDKRLQSFIDSITEHSRSSCNNNINWKSNIYENILKARNTMFNSAVGTKEHMVSYLDSGKSRHATQVFSKQGGKSTRPVLENILKNSEDSCKFTEPVGSSIFFTFDNIQTLLKSHRICGENQKKALAIVVTSILCLKPDGDEKKSSIQYKTENCPAAWLYQYKFNTENNCLIQRIDTAILKESMALDEEDLKLFEQYFEKELEKAIEYVKNDIQDQESLQDSVDIKAKAMTAKRRKLCENGHINTDVRTNRKVCDREYCKARLNLQSNENDNLVIKDSIEKEQDKSTQRANMYLNVPNVLSDEIPTEKAVGAIAVNPNTPERIARVLDEIIEAAGMKNEFAVKIVITGNSITKNFVEDETFRKHIVVTADGLPYKIMIDLIENCHTCAMCGKRITHVADLTEHMKETKHNEFFQTYGNILPNIGYFHYALTMLRSLVNLEWDIDYQELCKAIHFETPKALFMQSKVTDFRKSLDTYRTVREAKIREFVTPFVKYSIENKLDMSINSFLRWKSFFVKSELYKTVFEIEKYYGTGFILFHAALRANNFKLVKIAKKVFSPLFHINRHPNYSIMDIHTDYIEQNMSVNAPELKDYLQDKRCSNLTRQPYASEPHDERHEEFNKRGLNMQTVKTVADFKQSFQLVDHYNDMKNSCFDDYDIVKHGGNTLTNPDYDENVCKMLIFMRQNSYLSKPKKDQQLLSLANEELDPKLPNLVEIAKLQKQEDVLNVIRFNDFSHGYKTKSNINILKNESKDKLGVDYESQLRILIASEENAELRENLRDYCIASRNHPDFNEEKLVEDILARNFSFL